MAAWMLDVRNDVIPCFSSACCSFLSQSSLPSRVAKIALLYFIQKLTNTTAYSMSDSTEDNCLLCIPINNKQIGNVKILITIITLSRLVHNGHVGSQFFIRVSINFGVYHWLRGQVSSPVCSS